MRSTRPQRLKLLYSPFFDTRFSRWARLVHQSRLVIQRVYSRYARGNTRKVPLSSSRSKMCKL